MVDVDREEVPVRLNAEKAEARIDLVVEEDDASVDSDIDDNEVDKHEVDERSVYQVALFSISSSITIPLLIT